MESTKLNLNSFLTEIMLLAGLGALLDNVFITAKERAKISTYLESGTVDLSLSQRFSNFLARAHSIIFGRFFATKLLSWGFLLSAAAISVISFSLVIGIQAHFFPEQFVGMTLDRTQTGLFIAFILFNVVFDYATIIQTKIFIEASLAAKSIFRAMVFIIADFIVTMNTFILSYAVFVLFVVQFFVSSPEQATMILADRPEARKLESDADHRFFQGFSDYEFTKKLQYRADIGGAVFAKGDEENAENVLVYIYATFDPKAAETQAYLLTTMPTLNLSGFNLSFVEDEGDHKKYSQVLDGLKSDLQKQLDGELSEEKKLLKVDFVIDASVSRSGSTNAAYTGAFYLTDQLEDAFPASIVTPMELPLLSKLITDTVTSLVLLDPPVVCFEEGVPTKRFGLNSQTAEFLEACTEFAVIDIFWSNNFDKDLVLIGREIDGYRVPFNTLLITSILPTSFFYLAIVLLAVATVCFSKIIKSTNRLKRFILRAPLAISGLILGIVLSLTNII